MLQKKLPFRLNTTCNITLFVGGNGGGVNISTKILTFLSDFGMKSSYVSQMKAVALSITNDVHIVDITHEITPHNVREGAFVLKTAVPFFPTGTVHVAVVDPGVGTNRKGIVITTESQILIGPDNGLLIPAAQVLGHYIVYEIQNTRFMLKLVSNTFHGRDIFTPVAAHILNGVLFEEIGPVVNDYVKIDFEGFKITNNTAIGKIVYIDGFGNIITNIEGDRLQQVLEYGKKIMLFINGKQQEIPFVKTYGSVKPGEILATVGSHRYLEISVNQGNAALKLDVKPDDEVKIFF